MSYFERGVKGPAVFCVGQRSSQASRIRSGKRGSEQRKKRSSGGLRPGRVWWFSTGLTTSVAAVDDQFRRGLQDAFHRMERLFKRIEALRVSLAKHELPRPADARKDEGNFAIAPGYSCIHEGDGSIYEIVLRGNEVDQVSPREIADDRIYLGSDRRDVILLEQLQEKLKLKSFPDLGYGVKSLVAVLDDGTAHAGVHVAWRKEIRGAIKFVASSPVQTLVRGNGETEQVIGGVIVSRE